MDDTIRGIGKVFVFDWKCVLRRVCKLGFVLFFSVGLGLNSEPQSHLLDEKRASDTGANPVLDLRNHDFLRAGKIRLNDGWEFYWKTLLVENQSPPESALDTKYQEKSEFASGCAWIVQGKKLLPQNHCLDTVLTDRTLAILQGTKPGDPVSIPHSWGQLPDKGEVGDGSELSQSTIQVQGYGLYAKKIWLPKSELALYSSHAFVSSAARIWVYDGKNLFLIKKLGQPGVDSKSTIPMLTGVLSPLPVNGPVTLFIEVSNFHHRKGGFHDELSLDLFSSVSRERDVFYLAETFIAGLILMAGMYHLLLFSLRRQLKSALSFGLLCILVALRVVLVSQVIPQMNESIFSPQALIRLEYLTMTGTGVLVPIYLYYLFVGDINKHLFWVVVGYSGLASFFVLVANTWVFTNQLTYLQIPIALMFVLGGYEIFRKLYSKDQFLRSTARSVFYFFLVACAMTLHDIIKYQLDWVTPDLAGFGLLVFIMGQGYVIAKMNAQAWQSSEDLSISLKETNLSYQRFVPTPLLSFLNKVNILDVNLGDQIASSMGILFSDIRDFTSLSEQMTPEENFNFINSYLHRVSPVVVANNGFVDKFIGDAVMALFPHSPNNAIDSAIAMQEAIQEYNEHRAHSGYPPIRVGIGLHYGRVMLGIIGHKDRLEGTAISDTVNAASRIEGLTKVFRSYILMSGDLMDQLEEPSRYCFRFVGLSEVKGRVQPIRIYEVFDGIQSEVKELMLETRADFERGVQEFLEERYRDCMRTMKSIHQKNPDDHAAKVYYVRSRKKLSETAVALT